MKRPLSDGAKVSMARYETYKHAIEKYYSAIEQGFYVEALAICEGLMSDRMESLANQLSCGVDYSYSTIGKLMNNLSSLLKKHESPNWKEFEALFGKIKKWAGVRNSAIHELPKLDKDKFDSEFSVRYQSLSSSAKEGLELFRELDKLIANIRTTLKS